MAQRAESAADVTRHSIAFAMIKNELFAHVERSTELSIMAG
jgi:hypothetical protein